MMDIHSTRVMHGHNCWTDHEKLRSKVAFRIRQSTTGKGQVSRQSSTLQHQAPSAIGRLLSRRWTVLSSNGRRKKTQHQTGNWQLCSRSYTTQPIHTYLGKPDRKHQDWFDPNDQELQAFTRRRDQAHQRMLQTRSTRSSTAAYKDPYRLL